MTYIFNDDVDVAGSKSQFDIKKRKPRPDEDDDDVEILYYINDEQKFPYAS